MKSLFLGSGALFFLAGFRLIQVEAGLAFFAILIFVSYLVMTFLWSSLEETE